MKRAACLAIAIVACVLGSQMASAENVEVACSLSRDQSIPDIGLYTGVILLDPPWSYQHPGAGYYVDWWESIVGTDTGEETQLEWFNWPASRIDDGFWYQLYPLGGCDRPGIQASAFYITADAWGGELCWGALPTCYLTVKVVHGGYNSNGNPSGYYPCDACVPLEANAFRDWCFDGWTGDVNSSSPSIEVCMDGRNRTVTASFNYCPQPCDPLVDPECACDPATDPGCGPCDPWDPECWAEPAIIYNSANSPIVINFERGDYRLTGSNSPVVFDIHGIGRPVRIGWTAAGADEAFLCFDRNGNERIDDGTELFGNATRLKNGGRALNGFMALAEYDDNHDGFIDDQDAIWSQLLLWRDLNHDGVSQPAELTLAAASDLTGIRLDYHWSGRRDVWGNTFRYQALAWIRQHGSGAAAQPVYDIFFVRVP